MFSQPTTQHGLQIACRGIVRPSFHVREVRNITKNNFWNVELKDYVIFGYNKVISRFSL